MIFLLRRLLVLFVLFCLAALLRVVGGVARRRRNTAATAPGRARETARPSDGAMVRDRVCNTFLPRSRALVLEREGREHFFCSEGCRRVFLADPERSRRSA